MSRRLVLATGFAAIAALTLALGLWLWSRNGLAVWVDSAIAFCL
jgi:type IV secretory pathway TrbD component